MQNLITLRTPHFFFDELPSLLARDAIFLHEFSFIIFTYLMPTVSTYRVSKH